MPWDWIPVVGLSQKLGYLFFVVKDQELKLVPDSKLWGLGNIQFDSEVLVIHKKDLKALKHG
jgi:aldehyde:ferredoxin oxidoreductase